MKQFLLSVSVLFAMSVNAQDCSELFFSEYVEGWSQNKAIEVYNPTSASIDLSDYQVERYSNGTTNSSAGGITALTGTLASGDAFVLTSGETDSASTFGYIDAILFNMGDMAEPLGSYPTPMHMNGNDAMVLTKNGVIIDVIGRVGENPGGGWTDDASAGYTDANGGAWWTKSKTLLRKASVKQGITANPILFNPTLEYDSLPDGTYSEMGSHDCDCNNTTSLNENESISYVMYPNPAVKGGVVSINSNSKIQTIRVKNILGGKVMSLNTKSISTSDLSKGTYIISIEFMDGRLEENKLIVK